MDHSSIIPEQSHQEVMTLYKFLTYLERVKKITEYKLSYSDCSRGGQGGSDSFNVCLKQAHKYTLVSGASEKTTSKSFFGPAMTEVEGSGVVSKVFRFRYERVTNTIKVQKPYVMLLRAITLKPNQPVLIS